MGRVQLQDSWKTDIPFEELKQRLRVFFTRYQMNVVQDTGTAIELKQGSQFITRFLGGWFVNPKNFPKRAEIRLAPAERGVHVEVLVEETLGFGYLDPHFKSRYEAYFHEWMNALKMEIPPLH